MRAIAVVLLLIGSVLPAAAVDKSAIKGLTGEYLLARSDGEKGCRITLTSQQAIGGYALTGQNACSGGLAGMAEAMAWTLNDNGLIFLDATRKVILTLTEDETAIYATDSTVTPTTVLVPAAKGVDHLPTVQEVLGVWQMVRPNGPVICTVTFSDKPLNPGDAVNALSLSPDCDPAVTRMKLVSWSVEVTELQLYGDDGDTLSFTPAAAGFTKSSEGKPLNLIRKP